MQNLSKITDATELRFIPVVGPASLTDFVAAAHPRAQPWADSFVLARECIGAAERARLYRSVKFGGLVRIRPGVFLPLDLWHAAPPDERYLLHIRAAALVSGEPLVFAGASAAALWGLPVVGAWPQNPVVIARRAAGGRSAGNLVRRCEGLPPEIWSVDGLAATSLARTVVDVARFGALETAIAVADRALAAKPNHATGALAIRVDKGELVAELGSLGEAHGNVRARVRIEFADGDSGSVGESASRVMVDRLGFPRPVLQQVFRDELGRMFADFWWPDYNLVGEFDGKSKYLRDEFTGGRSPAQVVLDEKAREDRLRRLGPSVVRWDWADATSPARLRRVLLGAGLPCR